ncbi:MAG TPA: flavodoxin family protein [Methanoregulaceae archaeon]|nr:flavodoxin family protein [Methanoregulaceae archaeon]
MTKSLVIVYSCHHRNTERIAQVIGHVLDAPVKRPDEVTPEEISGYELIGVGSGIYHGRHHESLLSLADRLPGGTSGTAFLFSTAGITGGAKTARDHSLLREELQAKGYVIAGEFSCKGFNTNSFLKYFGGMNKGRPNAEDIQRAEKCARGLVKDYLTEQ